MSLVELARYTMVYEAELVRSRLEAAGFYAVVFDDMANGFIGWGRTIGIRVMILDDEFDDARQFLAEEP